MTVAELIEELLKLPQDADVYALHQEDWDDPEVVLAENGDVHL